MRSRLAGMYMNETPAMSRLPVTIAPPPTALTSTSVAMVPTLIGGLVVFGQKNGYLRASQSPKPESRYGPSAQGPAAAWAASCGAPPATARASTFRFHSRTHNHKTSQADSIRKESRSAGAYELQRRTHRPGKFCGKPADPISGIDRCVFCEPSRMGFFTSARSTRRGTCTR